MFKFISSWIKELSPKESTAVYIPIRQVDIPEVIRLYDECRRNAFSKLDEYKFWDYVRLYVEKGRQTFVDTNGVNPLYRALDISDVLNPRIKMWDDSCS